MEVGCGKGKFTVETAQAEPDVLLIAIERVTDALVLAMESAIRLLRCGRCGQVCPIGLVPQMMAAAAEKKDYARYEKKLYGLECIACGSCTFTCPAKRPLMQLFKQTKAEIMAAKRR